MHAPSPGPRAAAQGAAARSQTWVLIVALVALVAGLIGASRALAGGSGAVGSDTGGTDPRPPENVDGTLSIEPESHDFGEVEVGDTTSVRFTVFNSSGEVIDQLTVHIVGPGRHDFRITDDGCTGQLLDPEPSCQFTTAFTPTSEGDKEGEIEVESNAPDSPHTAPVKGTGVPKTPPSPPDPPLEPPDEGDDPRYDLFLERSAMAKLLTSADGVAWFPLVRRGSRVEVGKIPHPSAPRLDTWSTGGGADIWVSNSPLSQRASIPTDLGFRTDAPLRLRLLQIFEGDRFRDCSFLRVSGVCVVDALAPGKSASVHASWAWKNNEITERHNGRTFMFRWNATCRAPTEWECENNLLEGRFGLSFPPHSKPTSPRQWSRQFSGRAGGPATPARGSRGRGSGVASAAGRPRRTVKRADRPARVEIALVRLAKRQRGFRGGAVSAPDEPEGAASAAGGGASAPRAPGEAASKSGRPCLWLSSRKRQFKKVPAAARRVCADPVWLRAKLQKPRKGEKAQRWRFRLRKRLRPGRYVLYTRATTRRGMPEMVFNRKRGNRVPFRVTKRGQVRRGRGRG